MRKIVFVVSVLVQYSYGGLLSVLKENYKKPIPELSVRPLGKTSNLNVPYDVYGIDKPRLHQSSETHETNSSRLNKSNTEEDVKLYVFNNLNRSKDFFKNARNLEKSRKVHENEIIESGDNKPNNLSERSFIWLNTRYSRPLKTKSYNRSITEIESKSRVRPIERYNKYDRDFTIKKQRKTFAPLRNRLPQNLEQTKPNTPDPLFKPSQDTSKVSCDIPGHFTLDKKVSVKCIPMMSKAAVNEKFRQYFPFSMPSHKDTIKNVNKPGQDVNPSHSQFKSYNVKPHKESHRNKHVTSITRHKVKDSYGYPNSYQLHRSHAVTNSQLKPEELINYESNLFSDNNYVSPLDLTEDEDKLIERYIKHTLADNGVHILDEELRAKCPDGEQKNKINCMSRLNAENLKDKLFNYLEKKSGHIDTELDSRTDIKNLEPRYKLDYDDSLLLDDLPLNKTLADVFFSSINKINDLNN